MTFIELSFFLLFLLGMLLIVVPILSRLQIVAQSYSRSRFYKKRREESKSGNDQKPTLLDHKLLKSLDRYMSIAGMKIAPITMITICFLLFFVTILATYRIMPSPIHNILIATLISSIPLLFVWSRYQKKVLEMASVMMPTVQNFIGYFTDSENLVTAIYRAARTAPFEIQSEWNRLVLDLQTGEHPSTALIEFSNRVGNGWAEDFADILITHIETGSNITSSLFKLINEMQNAMYNEEKRITVLTIYKWGTLLMVILSIFIVWFNIKMDPKNYHYYFEDRQGIQIVTLSILVLFISFIGALEMGRKKFR
ncbi:type II secretion system F family protein [Paenibacillus gansuensis]|uniref:Type II secretion system F family protein n=1 Tax=Paenibacillus gansuensis TaxID=306542 RepID=A0ABW5PJL8_9BACL